MTSEMLPLPDPKIHGCISLMLFILRERSACMSGVRVEREGEGERLRERENPK